MDKKIIGLIGLGLALILSLSFIAYSNITKDSYQKGISDATLLINKQIVSNLVENGAITVYINHNQSIRLIPEQVCINQINQTQNKVIADCQNYIKQMQIK